MRTNLHRIAAAAAILAAGGAAIATAQDLPSPEAPAAAGGGAAEARPEPAQFRGDRDGGRDGRHHRGGARGAVLGAFGPSGAAEVIAAVDGDGDGALTQAEIDAFLAAQLEEADADGDGAVSVEEFAPLYFERTRPAMVDAFQALDADGSGTVAAGELDARFGGLVDRLDRDRDGDGALGPGDRGRRG